MRWVDVPYEIHDNVMHTMKTEWPARCACCAGSTDGAEYGITGHLNAGEVNYMAEFPVPFCTDCRRHAGPVGTVQAASGIGAFLLWALVGWLLFLQGLAYSVIGMVLFLASAVVLAYAAYQIAKRIIASISTARMKPECTNNDYAVSASPKAGHWRFEFTNDGYAEDFARRNGLQLLLPAAKPQ